MIKKSLISVESTGHINHRRNVTKLTLGFIDGFNFGFSFFSDSASKDSLLFWVFASEALPSFLSASSGCPFLITLRTTTGLPTRTQNKRRYIFRLNYNNTFFMQNPPSALIPDWFCRGASCIFALLIFVNVWIVFPAAIQESLMCVSILHHFW